VSSSSINFSATLSASAGTIGVGDVLCRDADGTAYVVATTANLALSSDKRPICIALTAGAALSSIQVQYNGECNASQLGPGVADLVRVDAVGHLQRLTGTNWLRAQNIVGSCDAAGRFYASFDKRDCGLEVPASYWGVVGDGTTDDVPALDRCKAALGTLAVGGTILLGPGNYRFASPFRIDKQIVVRGAGGFGSNAATTIKPDALVTAFIFEGTNTGESGVPGDGSVVEGLDIVGTRTTITPWAASTSYTVGAIVGALTDNRYYFYCTTAGTSGAGPADPFSNGGHLLDSTVTDGTCVWSVRLHVGVLMRAKGCVRDVAIRLVTNSFVHVQAGASETPSSNANGFQLRNLICQTGGAGITVLGSDANNGTAINVTVVDVGTNFGGVLGVSGYGHGIWDHSFLGCTWIGCHVDGVTGRGYVFDGGAGNSSALGCYCEASTQANYAVGSHVIVGGTWGPGWTSDTNATLILGDGSRNIFTRDPTHIATTGQLYTYLGNRPADGIRFYQEQHQGEPFLSGMCWSGKLTGWPTGWHVWTYNGNPTQCAWAAPGPNAVWPSGTAIGSPYGLLCVGPLYFGVQGMTTDPQKMDYGAAAPVAERHLIGSIRWNTAAAVGQPIGWMCTVTGTPGTWVAMTNL
jgi:hypothetical protein